MGNRSDLSQQLFFYNLFKSVLCLAHWPCCWDDFLNLCWLVWNNAVHVCNFRRRNLDEVFSPCYSLPHVSPSWIVHPFKLLYSAEFIPLRDKGISMRLEPNYCTVKQGDEANLIFTVPSKFSIHLVLICSRPCILLFSVIPSWKLAMCTILIKRTVLEGFIN